MRYAPHRPFPRYAHIPGQTPHPFSDPEGHSFGQSHDEPDEFLFGVDLFNHGYFWEAHEVWEGHWHATGREGALADFLKGLIQLAVAGVKVKQDIRDGVVRKAIRAGELFRSALQSGREVMVGLRIQSLIRHAIDLSMRPEEGITFQLVIDE